MVVLEMMRIHRFVSYVFKVKPVVFAEGLDVESEIKEKHQGGFQGFRPEQLELRSAIN